MVKPTRRDALKRAAAAGVALAGTAAVAAQGRTGGEAQHDLKKLEARAREVSQSLAKLGDGKDFQEFFQVIHKPGWTTPAEFALVMGLVDAMHAQATALAGLKQTLMEGSRAVAVN